MFSAITAACWSCIDSHMYSQNGTRYWQGAVILPKLERSAGRHSNSTPPTILLRDLEISNGFTQAN